LLSFVNKKLLWFVSSIQRFKRNWLLVTGSRFFFMEANGSRWCMFLFFFIQETKMRLNVILPPKFYLLFAFFSSSLSFFSSFFSFFHFLFRFLFSFLFWWKRRGRRWRIGEGLTIMIIIIYIYIKTRKEGKKKRKADAECFAWWVTYNAPSCSHFLDGRCSKNISIYGILCVYKSTLVNIIIIISDDHKSC